MRKTIAAVLIVLMIASVLITIPASTAAITTYDGTTNDTAGLNKIIISEIAPKATYHHSTTAEPQDKSSFPLKFMELYNNGAGDVDLSTLSILRGVNYRNEPYDETDPYLDYSGSAGSRLWRLWRDEYKFVSKIDIKPGKIVDDRTAELTGAFEGDLATDVIYQSFLTNEGQDMTFSNGENVVLWFVDGETVDWLTEMEMNGPNFNPRKAFIKSFYGEEANVSDYTVLMVWAWSDFDLLSWSMSIATDTFTLTMPAVYGDHSYIYGVANNTWNLNSDRAYDYESGINEELYSMVVVGSDPYRHDRYYGMNLIDKTATFALPTTKPYVENAYKALTDVTPPIYNNYFEAGLVTSFREAGVINWASAATPGTMPAWQWAMIDPSNYDAFKTEGVVDDAKVQATVDAYLKELKLIDDGSATGRDEVERDYSFTTQEDLKNQFFQPQHVHTYSNACDATCNDCQNGNRTPAAHVYTGACDDTCNVCRDLKPGADQSKHVFTNDCDNSCDVCGSVRPVGNHVYTNNNDTACNICGKAKN